ncbi:MAG: diaminopimelate epimerase [Bacteroidota bacterium]
MQVPFYKYQGTGNDFILLDSRETDIELSPELIRIWCDRRFGIGADGLMRFVPSAEGEVDFLMQYFNSDGEPGSMCGNGGRCIVRHASLTSGLKTSVATFRASDGVHEASVLPDGKVVLAMKHVDSIEPVSAGHFLDTGSPHLVVQVEGVDSLDVVQLGRNFRNTWRDQPAGTNVNFIEKNGDRIRIRTYERGVEDETFSCGTGVTAAALVAFRLGWFNTEHVILDTRGGELQVNFQPDGEGFRKIQLTGPAERIFQGTIDI